MNKDSKVKKLIRLLKDVGKAMDDAQSVIEANDYDHGYAHIGHWDNTREEVKKAVEEHG